MHSRTEPQELIAPVTASAPIGRNIPFPGFITDQPVPIKIAGEQYGNQKPELIPVTFLNIYELRETI